MSQLFATLYPSSYTPPSGTIAKSHKAIPQKDEPKVTTKMKDYLKAQREMEAGMIVVALEKRKYATAALISEDIGLSLTKVANMLRVLTNKGQAVRHKARNQTAIYSLS